MRDIKAMDDEAKEAHAAKCASDRGIKATAVKDMAVKLKCPDEHTTQTARLAWIFKECCI